MDTTYNRYNLEADFKNYLLAGIDDEHKNVSIAKASVKGYLSDWRHFLGYLIQLGLTQAQNFTSTEELKLFLLEVTPEVMLKYRTAMISAQVPLKTMNRRFSTVRKFFTFCIQQGWLEQNPTKTLANVNSLDIAKIELATIFDQFCEELQAHQLQPAEQKNRIDDIKSFIGKTTQ